MNVAFFSDDASDEESLKARILEVAALGPQIVVATRGGKGSLAYDGESFYPARSFRAPWWIPWARGTALLPDS